MLLVADQLAYSLCHGQTKWQGQLQPGLFGVMNITWAILPHFCENDSGGIAIISSILEFQGRSPSD